MMMDGGGSYDYGGGDENTVGGMATYGILMMMLSIRHNGQANDKSSNKAQLSPLCAPLGSSQAVAGEMSDVVIHFHHRPLFSSLPTSLMDVFSMWYMVVVCRNGGARPVTRVQDGWEL